MRDLNLFGAGLLLGFAVESIGRRRWGAFVVHLFFSAFNLACVVWL